MSWTFTTSGAALAKAGFGVNSDITQSGAAMAKWSDESEALINAETRYDWITNYSSIPTNFKQYLGLASAAYIAKQVVSYDMSGYALIGEPITKVNILDDELKGVIEKLKTDQDVQKALGRTF